MDSEVSKKTQETFSMTVQLMGDYIIKIAIIEFPFLAIPGIRQVFSYIVKKVLSKVQEEGELSISFAFIDNEMDNKKELYQEAIDKLKEVLATDKPEEQKNEAIEETKKRLRDLIRFPTR